MTLTTAYAALGAGAAVWAVLVSRLMAKPWLTKDAVGALRERRVDARDHLAQHRVHQVVRGARQRTGPDDGLLVLNT